MRPRNASAMAVILAVAAVAFPAAGAAGAPAAGAAPGGPVAADHAAHGTNIDGDGFSDLVVGAPLEDVSHTSNAGAITVMFGGTHGFDLSRPRSIDESTPALGLTVGAGDEFGAAIAAADFDHDGFTDVAIGIPNRKVAGVTAAGAVEVVYGSSWGVDLSRAQLITAKSTDPSLAVADGQFGAALTAGDFDGDGVADLAIGEPGGPAGGAHAAGDVEIAFGSHHGVTHRVQVDHQGLGAIGGVPEAGDHFGAALAAADFGHGQQADLAIGVPGEDVNGVTDAGVAQVLYGSSTGLTGSGSQLFTEKSLGVGAAVEAGDEFGSSVAGGDLGRSSSADLAIGAPSDSIGSTQQAGAVFVVYGASGGLTTTGAQVFSERNLSSGAVAFAHFSASLSIGNAAGTSTPDLLIGAPGDGGGVVFLLFGAPNGLATTPSVEVLDIFGDQSGNEFGASIAIGDYTRSAHNDVVVGTPGLLDGEGSVALYPYASGELQAPITYNQTSVGEDAGIMDEWSQALA